jgi:hypothetical protein
MLPLSKIEGEEKKYKTDLSLTPFYNYENDVVLCSSDECVDHSKVIPLNSYLMLRYGGSWLAVDSKVTMDDHLRVGLIPEFINRGDESRYYSYNFNAIATDVSQGTKTVVILGYIILEDQVLFINRFDFEDDPSFRNHKCQFVPFTPQEFFSEKVLSDPRLDKNSQLVMSLMGDVIPDSLS